MLPLHEQVCRSIRLPDHASTIKARAELLCPDERELIEELYDCGRSAAAVARLTGESPRTVRCRLGRLLRRMRSRRFVTTARAMPYLEPTSAQLARMHFCEGRSHRELARRLGCTVHVVRRRLDQVEAQIDLIARPGLSQSDGAAQES